MIFYLLADHEAPSWGAGMIYEHVRLLVERGLPACVLHQHRPFRPRWLESQAPIRYLDDRDLAASPPGRDDVVVVPEVLAAAAVVRQYAWRRVVFVQGGYLILPGLEGAPTYAALGYERAMVTLPHLERIVTRHFAVPAGVVPPFVAPYFFAEASGPRRRRVLVAVKDGYRQAGLPDHQIALALLQREVAARPDWSLEALEGLDHRDVARRMRESTFLVNVHSLEGFNATVPEAMAAGCVPLCYLAVGGRDFLLDGENALVFPDHDVYALVARLCELMDGLESAAALLERLRAGGRRTAEGYRAEATAEALLRFFSAG
jgi:hypothetical protein